MFLVNFAQIVNLRPYLCILKHLPQTANPFSDVICSYVHLTLRSLATKNTDSIQVFELCLTAAANYQSGFCYEAHIPRNISSYERLCPARLQEVFERRSQDLAFVLNDQTNTAYNHDWG